MTPPQTKDNSSICSDVPLRGSGLLSTVLSLLLFTPFSLLTRSLLPFPHKLTLEC